MPSPGPFDNPEPYHTWPEAERVRYLRHLVERISGVPGGSIVVTPLRLLLDELERLQARLRALELARCPSCSGHTGVCVSFEDWDVVSRAVKHANGILDAAPKPEAENG